MEPVFERQRATLLMEQQGMDLLLGIGIHNVGYLSGYWGRSQYAEFLVDGEPNFVLAALPKDPDQASLFIAHVAAKVANWMEEQRYYGRSPHLDSLAPGIYHFLSDLEKDTTLAECLATALAELGLPAATIGLDLDHTPVNLFQELRDALPQATFVDASSLFWRLRMVKSEEEIKRIRKAARVGELAMQAAFDVAQEGVCWGALWDAIEQTYEQEGAEHAFIHLGFGPKARQDGAEWEYEYVQSGCYLPSETGIARDKPLWRGDVGRIDLGCFVEKPYHCDLARVAVVGEATDEMKRVYAAMVESYRRIAAAMKPGVEAAQLFHIGYRPLADAGLHPTVVLLGHGLGVDTHEPPWLLPTDHTPLQAGMVLTIEVVFYTDQLWSMNLEDMVLVTEEGCEFLTTWGHIDGLPQMVVMS